MLKKTLSRRSVVGTGAALGAGAMTIGAPSSIFAAPALVQNAGSKVPVNYWTSFTSGVNGDAQKKLIADFNAANPDIEVTSVDHDSYEAIAQALITGLQTGDNPDVLLFSEAWWFRFYLAGVVKDLNELITPETKADDYVPTLFKEYQRNGGQYAIPFARSTPLLYINTDLLDQAGLDVSMYETWDAIAENGPKLIADSDAEYAFAFGSAAGYGAWYLQGTVWGFDGAYSDADLNILLTEEGAVEAGEFLRTLINDKTAAAVTDPVQDFRTGVTAATFASTGSLGGIRDSVEFNFKTAFLPAQHTFGCGTGGSGLAMINTSPDEVQQAAWKFIEYCTSTEVTTYWSQTTGYMPVRLSARDSDEMQAFFAENPNSKTAVDQLEKVQQVDTVMVMVPNGAQIIGQGWEQILVNNTPAADAWEETKSVLDTEKEPVLEQISAVEGE
jgi:sn-glycerol 3-phosphate transport system substrate-binding protein